METSSNKSVKILPLLFSSALVALFAIGVVPDAPARDAAKKAAAPAAKASGTPREPKDDFDRLDGKGPSRKRVDVIEWEGNLEVHVYPKGSLKSLGLKVDRTNKNRPVMVVEYAFNGLPYTLIRRAILSIKIEDQFLTFKAPSDDEYDKIMVSNNSLEGVAPYPVHAPRQMYPDYFGEDEAAPAPAPLADGDEKSNDASGKSVRSPASEAAPVTARDTARDTTAERPKTYEGPNQNAPALPGVKFKKKEIPAPNLDEDGFIRSFEF